MEWEKRGERRKRSYYINIEKSNPESQLLTSVNR